ncbi:trypsin, alkaline A-like [Anticarsia gemmatalis]|uniref:trypsin, alkaline A-like n=1 Tax=Anticarsia gemmatalis TaxID=129554 RepID=UPI003F774AB3
MRVLAFLVLCVAAASAVEFGTRIIGGSVTSIRNYPEMVALLFSPTQVNHRQSCGGSILNQRSVLTAAHCFDLGRHHTGMWRMRIGSDFANSGGTVLVVAHLERHPNYNRATADSDVAILRSTTAIRYGTGVQPANLGGYVVGDNEVVWAAGWGQTEYLRPSEQLRHVQIWTINQGVCRQRYGQATITDNMLCSGVLDVGGRDQCSGDSGGPLYHNGNVVGICSWGEECALPFYPGVNVRVSRFIPWIQNNA